MTQTTENFSERLATLQTRIRDALNGFDEIRKKAEPEIHSIIAEHIALHTRHEAALSARLRELGHQPDEDGSFFSVVQRLIIKTRAAFTDIDSDVLGAVADGEERISQLYADAAAEAISDEDRAMLQGQRAQLESLIARTRIKAEVA